MMLRKLPFGIAILGMIGGVCIAILFGVNEDIFKSAIQDGLSLNAKIQRMADPQAKAEAIEKESAKNWRYYQRFHFHSIGIGATSLSLLLFLAFVGAPAPLRHIAGYLTAVGGFFYPFVWLFAAIYGPEMGRHEAKEAFAVFGYAGGVFLVGVVMILGLTVRYPLRIPRSPDPGRLVEKADCPRPDPCSLTAFWRMRSRLTLMRSGMPRARF